MRRCPITYEAIESGRYSARGLRKLSPKLDDLNDLPYTQEEQIQEAQARAAKMSLPGVQPKLSARLNVRGQIFEIVDIGGQFVLEPQSLIYPELPQNEDLSMRLASTCRVDVPLHGLLYSKDGLLTYFVKRFDRHGKRKFAVEDFGQLAGLSRETKYDYSMEKLAPLLEQYCTFPQLDKLKLFRLTLFNYLIGNEDAHVKNFSLIRRGAKVELTPAYDLLNTTIAMPRATEEIALPLGRKRKLNREIFVDYFARERLQLTDRAIRQVFSELSHALPEWQPMIDISFLSNEMKERYSTLIRERRSVLGLD